MLPPYWKLPEVSETVAPDPAPVVLTLIDGVPTVGVLHPEQDGTLIGSLEVTVVPLSETALFCMLPVPLPL
jgi:hypothetical protein